MNLPRKKTAIVIAALLLVIGAGTAFAAAGISLDWRNNTVYISNSNSQPYNVSVRIIYSANGVSGQVATRDKNVKAGKTEPVSIGASAIIEHAEVISASPGL
jgi:polygalacturonase